MARRIDPIFREILAGFRRNGSLTLAAVSTAFISVFLLGGALLINRQANLIIAAETANVEVNVFLTDPVNSDTVAHLTQVVQALPVVDFVHYVSKQEACHRFAQEFASDPGLVENTPCSALPASLDVKLANPDQFGQVAAVLGCTPDATGKLTCAQPGIEQVRDNRTVLNALFSVIRFFRVVVGMLAVVALVASALLIANAVRIGLFARRKEIGIMKLVGATNWRIRAPFMVEGVLQGIVGAGFAVLALFVIKVVFVDPERTVLKFLPFIRNADILAVTPILVSVSVVVSVLASVLASRRFLDV